MNRRKESPNMFQAKYAKVGTVVKNDDVRFGVGRGVFLPGANWDPVQGVLPDHTPRFYTYEQEIRRQKEERKAKREIKTRKSSVPRGMAWLLCVVWALVCLVLPGTVLMDMGQDRQELARLNLDVKAIRSTNEVLRAELADATEDVKIRYAAAQNLGMIPSEAAQAIGINVPVVPETKAWEKPVKQNGVYARIYSALDRP